MFPPHYLYLPLSQLCDCGFEVIYIPNISTLYTTLFPLSGTKSTEHIGIAPPNSLTMGYLWSK